jgi:hypothetical protein
MAAPSSAPCVPLGNPEGAGLKRRRSGSWRVPRLIPHGRHVVAGDVFAHHAVGREVLACRAHCVLHHLSSSPVLSSIVPLRTFSSQGSASKSCGRAHEGGVALPRTMPHGHSNTVSERNPRRPLVSTDRYEALRAVSGRSKWSSDWGGVKRVARIFLSFSTSPMAQVVVFRQFALFDMTTCGWMWSLMARSVGQPPRTNRAERQPPPSQQPFAQRWTVRWVRDPGLGLDTSSHLPRMELSLCPTSVSGSGFWTRKRSRSKRSKTAPHGTHFGERGQRLERIIP